MNEKLITLFPGVRFRPWEEELVVIMGHPLPYDCVPETPLYSGEPWRVLENHHWDVVPDNSQVPKMRTYIFTTLTKKKQQQHYTSTAGGGTREMMKHKQKMVNDDDDKRDMFVRTAGCGTWKAQNFNNVVDESGKVVGFKRLLSYEFTRDNNNNHHQYHYTMHEFSVVGGHHSDYVLCEVTRSLINKKRKATSSCGVDEDDHIPRVSKRAGSIDHATTLASGGPSSCGVVGVVGGCDGEEESSVPWADYNSTELSVVDQLNPDELVEMVEELFSNTVQVQLPQNIVSDNHDVGGGTAHGCQANDKEQVMIMMGRSTVDIDGIQHPLEETEHMEALAQPIHAALCTTEDDDGLMTFLEQLSNDNIQAVQKPPLVTKADYVSGGLPQPYEDQEQLFSSSGNDNVDDGVLQLLDFGKDDGPYWSCWGAKGHELWDHYLGILNH